MPKPYKLLKSSSKHDNPRLSFWFFKRCIDLKTEVDITYANEDSLNFDWSINDYFRLPHSPLFIRGKYEEQLPQIAWLCWANVGIG